MKRGERTKVQLDLTKDFYTPWCLFSALMVWSLQVNSQTVAENIRPVGQLCVAGQACVGKQADASYQLVAERVSDASTESESDALSATESVGDSSEATLLASSSGVTHEVQMRNQGSDGVMVFEPSVLQVQVGDSVTFKASDAGHNSASIEGMIPPGAEAWDGGMSQDITITLTEEGTYVYQCTPHLMMAMVGVITVGDLNRNFEEIEKVAADKKSAFVMEQGRLDSYLQRLR